MVNLLEHTHAFTVNEVIADYKERCDKPKPEFKSDLLTKTQTSIKARFIYDNKFEKDNCGLSRLAMELCISISMYKKKATRFLRIVDLIFNLVRFIS